MPIFSQSMEFRGESIVVRNYQLRASAEISVPHMDYGLRTPLIDE